MLGSQMIFIKYVEVTVLTTVRRWLCLISNPSPYVLTIYCAERFEFF